MNLLKELICLRNDIVGQDENCTAGYETQTHEGSLFCVGYLFNLKYPVGDSMRIRKVWILGKILMEWREAEKGNYVFFFPIQEQAVMFDEMTREITKELIRQK